jgi:hypothetical protein
MTQLELIPFSTPSPPGASIASRCERFIAANPHILDACAQLIREEIAAGMKRISFKYIIEKLRRDPRFDTAGEKYKLNNTLTAPLLDELLKIYPEWTDYFERRKRRET